MPAALSKYVKANYPDSKADLFAVFMERLKQLTKSAGYYAMITQHQWMFLSSFEKLRQKLQRQAVINLAHLGTHAFEEIGGEVVQSVAFVIQNLAISGYVGTYERLVSFESQQSKQHAYLDAVMNSELKYVYRTNQANFEKIPGNLLGYWIPPKMINKFNQKKLSDVVVVGTGMRTGDNARFLRRWYEVSRLNSKFKGATKADTFEGVTWVPYSKGGGYRKWYGNHDYLVNWAKNGLDIKNNTRQHYPQLGDNLGWKITNEQYYFLESITWSSLTTGQASFRHVPTGYIFDTKGPLMLSNSHDEMEYYEGLLNSTVGFTYLSFLAPTMDINPSVFSKFPIIEHQDVGANEMLHIIGITSRCEDFVRADWDSTEYSWDFQIHPLVISIDEHQRNWTVEAAFNQWAKEAEDRFNQLKANEEELNRIFIDLYGLQDELTPEETDKEVSVRKADRERDIRSFLSYFIGVTFGRYSIDTPGLAFAGGEWDDSKYMTYQPNKDDIILLTDDDYFGDERDIIFRLKQFLTATFGEANLAENVAYIAASLGKSGDTPEAQIRKYLLDAFYKEHLSIYQKRPIYWRLDSGRQGGFAALMYLHRYDGNTMAMIRTKYLHPLQDAYNARLTQLRQLIQSESNVREKATLNKQISKLEKQIAEIVKYDQSLSHVANMHIAIDLDDGVVVNHAKVQDDQKILAPIK